MIRLVMLLVCMALPAGAQVPPDAGPWFASYTLDRSQSSVDMTVQVMQIAQSPSADVTLNFYKQTDRCPQASSLCTALPTGLSSVQAAGARIYADELRVAFYLPGGSGRWLLRIVGAAGVRAEIHHEVTLQTYASAVRRGPHLCEQAMCSSDVADDLRGNPFARLGDLADDAWTRRILARAATPPAPTVPARGHSPQDVIMNVLRPNGDPLGQITLSESGGQGQGVFEALLPQGSMRAELALRKQRGTAQDWIVTLTGGGTQTEGRMLLDHDALRGTIKLGNLVQLVHLEPLREDDPQNDLPGFGIYAPEYALRGVPLDRSLWVRASPDQNAATVMQLGPKARGLFVFACTPEPDNIAYDLATPDLQEQMLDALWCQIGQTGTPMGWVRGKYLTPIQR